MGMNVGDKFASYDELMQKKKEYEEQDCIPLVKTPATKYFFADLVKIMSTYNIYNLSTLLFYLD